MPFEIGHSTLFDSVHLYLHVLLFRIVGGAACLHVTNLHGVVGVYHSADVAGAISPVAIHTFLFEAFCGNLVALVCPHRYLH